jgi:hypothetical protein
MADAVWKTYAVTPLGFAGIATFLTWVVAGDSPILEVAAFVDTVPTTDPTHLPSTAVKVPLNQTPNAAVYAEGLPYPLATVSWFTRTAAGWVAGPVRTDIAITSTWEGAFPYPKTWAIELLQKLERETQPLGSKILAIRGGYPRDSFPVPCISLLFEANPTGALMVGDIGQELSYTQNREVRGWDITLQVILWCDTPEDRDMLIPWLGKVTQALIHLAPYQQFSDPTFNITETEDFTGSKAEMPLFIGMVTITGKTWSNIDVPMRNPQGHFTV